MYTSIHMTESVKRDALIESGRHISHKNDVENIFDTGFSTLCLTGGMGFPQQILIIISFPVVL